MRQKDKYRVLVINPGSTSTKIAVYENEEMILSKSLRHSSEELARYPDIPSQYEFRADVILGALREADIDVKSLDAVVGRGGLLYPLESGTYRVNELMLDHLRKGVQGQHASNLGGLLAYEIAKDAGGVPSFIVDPVIVDELEPIARLSGNPLVKRRSIFHALNHKSVARRAAEKLGKKYEDVNLIVAHLGGGISVGAHRGGRVVDVNNALDGDGPFSPERSGGLPAGDLARICFSGKYRLEEIIDQLRGKGGMVAYLGTNDIVEAFNRADGGDEKAKLVLEAMAYQIAKEIGSLATVLFGKVDAIVLTGGIAYSERFIEMIKSRVDWIAKVMVFPGEGEMEALVGGALRVLRGEEEAKEYKPNIE